MIVCDTGSFLMESPPSITRVLRRVNESFNKPYEFIERCFRPATPSPDESLSGSEPTGAIL